MDELRAITAEAIDDAERASRRAIAWINRWTEGAHPTQRHRMKPVVAGLRITVRDLSRAAEYLRETRQVGPTGQNATGGGGE